MKNLDFVLSFSDNTNVQLSPEQQKSLDLPRLTNVGSIRDAVEKSKVKPTKMVSKLNSKTTEL